VLELREQFDITKYVAQETTTEAFLRALGQRAIRRNVEQTHDQEILFQSLGAASFNSGDLNLFQAIIDFKGVSTPEQLDAFFAKYSDLIALPLTQLIQDISIISHLEQMTANAIPAFIEQAHDGEPPHNMPHPPRSETDLPTDAQKEPDKLRPLPGSNPIEENLIQRYPAVAEILGPNSEFWVSIAPDSATAQACIPRKTVELFFERDDGKPVNYGSITQKMIEFWSNFIAQPQLPEALKIVQKRGIEIVLSREQFTAFLWFIHKKIAEASDARSRYRLSQHPLAELITHHEAGKKKNDGKRTD
jgi:hypothetical protein